MSKIALRRAEDVGNLPHVETWIERFRKLAKEMPPEVWIYVASSTVHVMACDEKNRPIDRERGDGTDPDGSITIVRGGHWDGGDW